MICLAFCHTHDRGDSHFFLISTSHNDISIPSCRSYRPPLWLWNVNNLSTAYKEAEPLSHDLYEEDSRHHLAKTDPDTEVLTRVSLPSIYTILMQSQLHWAGHVVHKKHHRLPKKLLYGELSQGKRSEGGPKKRFKDTLEVPMKSFDVAPNCLETSGVKLSNAERKFVKPEETQQLSCAGNIEKALSHQPLLSPFHVLTAQIGLISNAFLKRKVYQMVLIDYIGQRIIIIIIYIYIK